MGPRRRAPDPEGYRILVTGTFHSDNWVSSHLRPLASAARCSRVRVVSVHPVAPMAKVESISPPRWLVRLVGRVPARLATFVGEALSTRPHVVGGFHLLFNGLLAALVARCVGARSLYLCVGGPAEILGGGIDSENRLFGRLTAADFVIEQKLLRAISSFDLIVTMGKGAASFFRERGVAAPIRVISGGIDRTRFRPSEGERPVDVILVGRLAPIKRIDTFLRALQRVTQTLPDVAARVVGEGPLREPLEQLARDLGIDRNVVFVGHQTDVETWLGRARLFVLTSDSEGLPLSLVEAMMSGLPAVVSDVGDVSELVVDGVNGHLVKERTLEAFADRIVDLLSDASRWRSFSDAARETARGHEVAAATRRWEDVFREWDE